MTKSSLKNEPIRVGVAGLGGIAKRTHLPVLKLVPGFKVICGAEKDDYQRERVARLFNLEQTYKDYKEMIEQADIDAVFVCLPANLHVQAVCAALERGLHVFCEKPMGINSEEARTMIQLAEKKGRVLMPGYNLRHVDNFLRAKKLIESGKLGKIIQINASFINPGPYISWDPKTDWYLDVRNGGALYDIGSHLIDLLFYLYPHQIKKISAYADKGYEPYDVLTNISCTYEGEDGLLGAIQIGWRSASEVCSLEFHGTAGSLIVSRRNFSYTHGATDPADRIFNSLHNSAHEVRTILNKLNRMRKGADVLEEFIRQTIELRELILSEKPISTVGHSAIYIHEVLGAILSSVVEKKEIILT